MIFASNQQIVLIINNKMEIRKRRIFLTVKVNTFHLNCKLKNASYQEKLNNVRVNL